MFDIFNCLRGNHFIDIFTYVHGNEFIDKIKGSYFNGNQIKISDYALLSGKNIIAREIRGRRNFHINRYSKGVLMILKINDPDYYNILNPDFFTANGEWILQRDKKTKKQHDLIESKDPSDCVVCLENYEKNDSYKLGCSCKFSCHKECIIKWLKVNNSCPFCKI